MDAPEDADDRLLRSVALRSASSIMLARQRAEQQLVEAQDELRRTNSRLQLALSAGHLGDWNWDAATDIVNLSPRAADIFGLGGTRGVTWTAMRDLLHEDDRDRARIAVEQSLAKRSECSIEYRVRRSSGEHCWVAASGLGTYTETGVVTGMTGVVQDITGRKDAENALHLSQARLQMAVEAAIDNARLHEAAQHAAEERLQLLESERVARSAAERLNDLKDEFLATFSHELRNSLSAILGWTTILRRQPFGDDNTRRGLEAIERNARVQTRLIEDLLDIRRTTAGKVRMDVQSVEPADVVEAAIETVRPAADARGIRLETVPDPDAGPVSGDDGR